MTFDEYQVQAAKTAVYPQRKWTEYLALGLAGEAGELANKVKKALRGDDLPNNWADIVVDELGDCLWYISEFARQLGIDLNEVAARNLSKLHDRKQRDVLKGSGDQR